MKIKLLGIISGLILVVLPSASVYARNDGGACMMACVGKCLPYAYCLGQCG